MSLTGASSLKLITPLTTLMLISFLKLHMRLQQVLYPHDLVKRIVLRSLFSAKASLVQLVVIYSTDYLWVMSLFLFSFIALSNLI